MSTSHNPAEVTLVKKSKHFVDRGSFHAYMSASTEPIPMGISGQMAMDMLQTFPNWFAGVDPFTPLAFGLVAVGGLIMGIAPSSLPMVGVIVGFTAGEAQTRKRMHGFRLSVGFVLGQASVDAAVGALFGFLGAAVISALASYLVLTNLLITAILVIMGLALLRKIRVSVPVLSPVLRKTDSFMGAYVLGIPFGLSACPTCTPMLLPVLGAAAATGEPWLGAALLFCFGLARGVPLLIAGTAAGAAKHIDTMARWVPVIERGSGVLLLVVAAYFLYMSAVYAGWAPPLWLPP